MNKAVSSASARGISPAAKAAENKMEKLGARRVELAEATLETLAELGYARTSLREIANNSQFSHGVLHYYFNDKVDLICCAVRYYKTTCATRYDEVVAQATSQNELLNSFCAKLCETLTGEAKMHRLWYDLRSQALFEAEMRQDVKAIDSSLEKMVWRIATRYAELGRSNVSIASPLLYAMFDGLFQRSLLSYIDGDMQAPKRLTKDIRELLPRIVSIPSRASGRR
jgi:AcrR family transcriptional regulator